MGSQQIFLCHREKKYDVLQSNFHYKSKFVSRDYNKNIIGKKITIIQSDEELELGRITWDFIQAREDSNVYKLDQEKIAKEKAAAEEAAAEAARLAELERIAKEKAAAEEAARLAEL